MPGFSIRDIGGNGSGVPATTRYLYNYMWQVELVFGDNVGLGRNGTTLIHLKDATLPSFVVNKEIVLGSALEYKYGKSVSWEDVKLTWYDNIGLISVMKEWRQRVWSADRGMRPANEYKQQTALSVLPPDSDDPNEVVRFLLHGSWPSLIRHGDLTYTSSDVKIVEVTVTYDWAEEDVRNNVVRV